MRPSHSSSISNVHWRQQHEVWKWKANMRNFNDNQPYCDNVCSILEKSILNLYKLLKFQLYNALND